MATEGYMSDIVQAWRDKIKASADSDERKKFMKTAAMCDHFYRGAMGTMWSHDFRKTYLGGIEEPKFQVTIAKAFELVAVVGPSVMWDYPGRVVKTVPRKPLGRSYFGPHGDEAVDQEYQAYLERNMVEEDLQSTRNGLMETVLNYTQREQPGGGLTKHSHAAITEGIVKGRGLLWVDTYSFPGSDRKLTKCDYEKVDRLYLDPDCCTCELTDCRWVARKRRNKYWELERKFGLPVDSLRSKCTSESRESLKLNNGDKSDAERKNGTLQKDVIEWFEVFSKEGIGTRSLLHRPALQSAFDEVVGDFAYLAIADGVEYPLNFPPNVAVTAEDEEAKARFQWPIPYYMDGRWPFAHLDFHPVPDSAWPIAPMAMGLGELVFLNVLVSCLMERVYNSTGTILVASKGLEDDIKRRLKTSMGQSFYVELSQQNQQSIDELVKWLSAPDVPRDAFTMIDYVSELFDRRTGLSDVLYGGHAGGKVSRSAADSTLMHEQANTRPDWMSRQAESWQTEVANVERIAAGFSLYGEDLAELLGLEGSQAWDELIASQDPEVYVRQMRCTLEANSIRKPNKYRDNANLQQTIQYIMPMMQTHLERTGDVEPINGYLQAIADAMDQDATPWLLPHVEPPSPQPPSPEEQAAAEEQQVMQQMEQAKLGEELRGKQLRNEKLSRETGIIPEGESAPVDFAGMGA